MSTLAFADFRFEHEDEIRKMIAATPRYSAWVHLSSQGKIKVEHGSFSIADEVLEFFEKHNAGGLAIMFIVHDMLRSVDQHQMMREKKYNRLGFEAFLNEATVSSAALNLWRGKQRATLPLAGSTVTATGFPKKDDPLPTKGE